ncbi:unnamed protein product, partial [Polarella glacialis]
AHGGQSTPPRADPTAQAAAGRRRSASATLCRRVAHCRQGPASWCWSTPRRLSGRMARCHCCSSAWTTSSSRRVSSFRGLMRTPSFTRSSRRAAT